MEKNEIAVSKKRSSVNTNLDCDIKFENGANKVLIIIIFVKV